MQRKPERKRFKKKGKRHIVLHMEKKLEKKTFKKKGKRYIVLRIKEDLKDSPLFPLR